MVPLAPLAALPMVLLASLAADTVQGSMVANVTIGRTLNVSLDWTYLFKLTVAYFSLEWHTAPYVTRLFFLLP